MPVGEYQVRVVVEAVDRASREVRRLEGSVRSLAQTIEREGGRASSTLLRMGSILRDALGFLAADLIYRTIDSVRAFAEESVRAFAEFERSITRLATLAAEPGQPIEELTSTLRAAAISASTQFAVGVNEAAEALDSLVKAGLSGREAVEALGAALVMARIEGVGFGEAADNLVQVMAQFGLTGSEAMRVVDALVNASRMGIGTASDFARGLANVGATAKAMGLSLEGTLALLVILERRLGSADEAGTALNRMLLDLGEIAGKLGVPIRGLGEELRDVIDVIGDVVEASRTLAPEWDTLRESLTGVDVRAVRALTTFMEMRESIEGMVESIRRSGTALETYQTVMETTAGRMDALEARVERLKAAIGEKLAPAWLTLQEAAYSAIYGIVNSFSMLFARLASDTVEYRKLFLENLVSMGLASREEAERIILDWVRVGEVTRREAAEIAAYLGLVIPELMSVSQGFSQASAEAESTASSMNDVSQASAGLSASLQPLPTVFSSLVSAFTQGRMTAEELAQRLYEIDAGVAGVFSSILQAVQGLQSLQAQLTGLKAELSDLNLAMMENQLAILRIQNAAQARADSVAVELHQLRQQLSLLQQANQVINTAIGLMREEIRVRGESAQFTQQEIGLLQQLASFIQVGARGRQLDVEALTQLIALLSERNILTQEEAQLLLQLIQQLQSEEAQRRLNIAALSRMIEERMRLGQATLQEVEALTELRARQRELQEESLRLRIREMELQGQIERTRATLDSMIETLRRSAEAAGLAEDSVRKLINALRELDGMTVEYTVVERRRVEEESGGGGVEGSRQLGGWVPRTGRYLLHRGEYVLPPTVIRHLRRIGIREHPPQVNLVVNIRGMVVGGVEEAGEVAERISREIARRIRI